MNNSSNDITIIKSMLGLEDSYVLSSSYFTKFQSQINESMRAKLACWMLELCEAEQLTNEIYSLSINLFDRLLFTLTQHSFRVETYHLQLFGSVCLFIASKLKLSEMSSKLDAFKLIDYTDNTYTLEEFLEWELVILDKLKWDVASIVPNDYIPHFFNLLNLEKEQMDLLLNHTYAFTAYCTSDFKLSFYPASMIAGASLLAAIKGLTDKLSNVEELNKKINELLSVVCSIDMECLSSLTDLIDDLCNQHNLGEEINENIQERAQGPVHFEEDDYDFDLGLCNEFDEASNLDDEDDLIQITTNDDEFCDSTSSCSYEQLMQSLSVTTLKRDSKKKCKIMSDADYVFNQIEELDLNRESTSLKPTRQNRKKNKSNNKSIRRRSRSSSANSSCSSSGISTDSNTNNYYCFQITPPLANALPMPSFH